MDYQEYQRSAHLSCANAQTRSSTTRLTRHSTDHPTNCQNKPNRLHQDVDCRDQNVHELYPILQEDMVSKAKSVEDDSKTQDICRCHRWLRRRISRLHNFLLIEVDKLRQ